MFWISLSSSCLFADHAQFAGESADARALQADRFDDAVGRAVADLVAAAERSVEDDCKRGEEVAENALRGEADGNATDAQAGDQSGDVDAEIVEHDDQRDSEQRDGDEQADEAHRAEQRLARIMFAAGAMLDRAEDQLARPDRRLEYGGDGPQEVDRRRYLARRTGIARDQFGGEHDDEEVVGARDRPADDRAPAAAHERLCNARDIPASAQAFAEPAQAVQRDDDHHADGERDEDLQPVRVQPDFAGGVQAGQLILDAVAVEDRRSGSGRGFGHKGIRPRLSAAPCWACRLRGRR